MSSQSMMGRGILRQDSEFGIKIKLKAYILKLYIDKKNNWDFKIRNTSKLIFLFNDVLINMNA